MIEITTGVAFLLSSMYGPANTPANATAASINTNASSQVAAIGEVEARNDVEIYLRKKFADTPILIEIARCESRFNQFDKDGNVVRGIKNNLDVGVMQINTKWHKESADKLGYDLMTLEGNTNYAKHLYEEQGVEPWKYSSKCWNNGITYNK